MIKLTIDGKPIEVLEGTTVLNAARQAGIEIPTLCEHPHLSPYGGCRLCLVEVEGMRTLQPSCTLPAGNNMVIKTNTEKTKAARKFVLTLIFSERNHFCPYCQVSGGDCELQNAAYHEGMTHWALQPNWQPYPVDASNHTSSLKTTVAFFAAGACALAENWLATSLLASKNVAHAAYWWRTWVFPLVPALVFPAVPASRFARREH